MSSAHPAPSHRKCARRPGRKAPTLRPDPNTSVTAGVRVVKTGYYYVYIPLVVILLSGILSFL